MVTKREFITELGALLRKADNGISLTLMDNGNAVCAVQERWNMCIADYINIKSDSKMAIAQKIIYSIEKPSMRPRISQTAQPNNTRLL